MIGIINYQGGNVGSLCQAVKNLGYQYQILDSAQCFEQVEKIIMPGQGRAGAALATLKDQGLLTAINNTSKPFLGICLGMQLLYEYLEEDQCSGLGILAGRVQRFEARLTCPQMGWNRIKISKTSPLLSNLAEQSCLYFANSYYTEASCQQSIASYEYGQTNCAAVQKNNFYGVQFHPEKSAAAGLQILKNFIQLC